LAQFLDTRVGHHSRIGGVANFFGWILEPAKNDDLIFLSLYGTPKIGDLTDGDVITPALYDPSDAKRFEHLSGFSCMFTIYLFIGRRHRGHKALDVVHDRPLFHVRPASIVA